MERAFLWTKERSQLVSHNHYCSFLLKDWNMNGLHPNKEISTNTFHFLTIVVITELPRHGLYIRESPWNRTLFHTFWDAPKLHMQIWDFLEHSHECLAKSIGPTKPVFRWDRAHKSACFPGMSNFWLHLWLLWGNDLRPI